MNKSFAAKKYPHVAVCVDKTRNYCRGVLEGIADYAETYGPWIMFVDSQTEGNYRLDWLKDWRGDGVLVSVPTPAQPIQCISGIPIVSLFSNRPHPGLPQVGNNNHAIGEMAAQHLLERQFRHFGFCGYPESVWSLQREESFQEALSKNGFVADIFHSEWPDVMMEWERVQMRLSKWLLSLPKPAGVMACSDHFAQLVLAGCRRLGIAVPEELAVLGVDNDEAVCRLSNPQLTSIIDDTRRIGFEAARLLHELMQKKFKPEKVPPVLISPLGIATRRSTDVTAIDDRLVANVARFIREHACDGLTVDDLAAKFFVSRSVLHRRFQQALKRSPHQEIVRIRMERVRNLLAQTNLSLEKIAEMSGFEHPEYLSVAFKREVGLTPGNYRKQRRSA